MIIVSQNGKKVMDFSAEFQRNHKNPFFDKTASRAEKDEYALERDEYIARRAFYEIGYEVFLKYGESLKDLDEFVPCESADSQCRMDCKYFGKNNCL